MTTKGSLCLSSISLRTGIVVGVGTSLLMAAPASAALTPAEINDFRNTVGNRVEAATILGGDYGIGGGSYFSSGGNSKADINVSKFGGSGDVGDPQSLGNLGIGWQPSLQGSMGYLTPRIISNLDCWTVTPANTRRSPSSLAAARASGLMTILASRRQSWECMGIPRTLTLP